MQETWVQSLGWENTLETETAVFHSSILAWEISWTEEPGGLQSRGLQRVRHDLATEQQQRRRWWGFNLKWRLSATQEIKWGDVMECDSKWDVFLEGQQLRRNLPCSELRDVDVRGEPSRRRDHQVQRPHRNVSDLSEEQTEALELVWVTGEKVRLRSEG